jgi:hypothetical protein
MIVDLNESLLKAKTEDSQGFREFLKTFAAWRLFGEDIPDNYLRPLQRVALETTGTSRKSELVSCL